MSVAFVAAVDWGALGEVVVAALVATVLFTVAVCAVIVTGTRAAELHRAHREPAGAIYTVLAGLSLLALAGFIVLGLVVMTSK
jgi:hypothetical protein